MTDAVKNIYIKLMKPRIWNIGEYAELGLWWAMDDNVKKIYTRMLAPRKLYSKPYVEYHVDRLNLSSPAINHARRRNISDNILRTLYIGILSKRSRLYKQTLIAAAIDKLLGFLDDGL